MLPIDVGGAAHLARDGLAPANFVDFRLPAHSVTLYVVHRLPHGRGSERCAVRRRLGIWSRRNFARGGSRRLGIALPVQMQRVTEYPRGNGGCNSRGGLDWGVLSNPKWSIW